MHNENILLSRKVVAERLGVSTRTVSRLQRAGRLPAITITGRLVRFRQADLQALLNDASDSINGRQPASAQ